MSGSKKQTSVLVVFLQLQSLEAVDLFALSSTLPKDIILLLMLLVLPFPFLSARTLPLNSSPLCVCDEASIVWNPLSNRMTGLVLRMVIALRYSVLITRPSAPQQVCLPSTSSTLGAGLIPSLAFQGSSQPNCILLRKIAEKKRKITEKVKLGVGSISERVTVGCTIGVFYIGCPIPQHPLREELLFSPLCNWGKSGVEGPEGSDLAFC